MALSPDFVGREYRSASLYQITAEEVRAFNLAIGMTALDVVPPTFGIKISLAQAERVIRDPELGLDFSRLVHGDQKFTYSRGLQIGDEVDTTTFIESIKSVAGNDIVVTRSELNVAGVNALTSWSTLVIRGESA